MAVMAGIGTVSGTVEDRAVVIQMRRRGPGETVAPYLYRRDSPPLRTLAEQLAEWLITDLPGAGESRTAMLVEDRAAYGWETLVAVADHAGPIGRTSASGPRHEKQR
jgi:hypothetical protein